MRSKSPANEAREYDAKLEGVKNAHIVSCDACFRGLGGVGPIPQGAEIPYDVRPNWKHKFGATTSTYLPTYHPPRLWPQKNLPTYLKVTAFTN